MKQTAQGLAALGRGPDTQLVHMTPGEVKSLQQLAMAGGGSLTINPHTGLPEAGFLSSMLPMLIGAGITAATGGAAAPWMVGLGVGGLQAARTGSISKGLMAGLGAYGGGSLGAALAGAGASTAGATAGALGVPGAATGAGSQAAMLAAQNQGFGQAGLEAIGSSAGVASGATPVIQSGLQSMGAGAQGLLSEQGRDAFMQNIGGGKGLAMAGLAAASPMMDTTTKQPDISPVDSDMGQRYNYLPGATTPTPMPDVPGYENQGENFGREQRYFTPSYKQIDKDEAKKLYGFAVGGTIEDMSNANAAGANLAMDSYTGQQTFADGGSTSGYTYDQASGKYSGGPAVGGGATAQYANGSAGGFTFNPNTRQYTKQEASPEYLAYQNMLAQQASQDPGHGGGMANGGMAQGSISDLGGYSDGGRLLRGPGDGVSDSIPAIIGKKQPARLADGEFVVPARIVSELGNGSTEAGARKLYAMMDRIQKGRSKTVGKGKVATNSRADKYLPV